MGRVLVIEDKAGDAELIKRRLKKAGWTVAVCSTAYEGIEEAKSLLNLATEPRIDLIILDWLLPQPNAPSLNGIVVAVELIRAIDEGEIHPAHIVVLSHNTSDERREDALGIGCSLVLEKPLSEQAVGDLQRLIQSPPVFSPKHRLYYRHILRFVKSTLEMLYEGGGSTKSFVWTRKSAKRLLEASIIYDLPKDEQMVVNGIGGFAKIKSLIETMDIPDERLSRLRSFLIEDPNEHWETLMMKMKTNKVYIYDYKNMLYELIADSLNQLSQKIETK